MLFTRVRSALVLTGVLTGLGLGCCAPALAQDDAAWKGSGPYMRVVDVDETHMRLDMAVRLFVPAEGDGPTIALAGAMHIARPTFYQMLQSFLDAQDLVLFEGVKPRGTGGLDAADDSVRVRRTEAAIRFLAIMLARHHVKGEAYPATLEELAVAIGARSKEQGEWVRSSAIDAWDHPLVYSPTIAGFDLRSLGADGKEGGEGFDKDLAFADQKPLTDAETGDDPGLQSQMARALGLAFQLEAMHMDRPNFRNSDLTIDQVQERVAERGGDASMLFKILDGSSLAGKVVRFLLGLIEGNAHMQAMVKVLLMETMAATDIENLGQMEGMPKGMAELMHVIVVDRNNVVIEDLKSVLAEKDPPKSIGIVYGAGHMGDMEKRLVADCGYRHVGGFWFEAISVDLKESGLSRAEVQQMERMLEMMQGGKKR